MGEWNSANIQGFNGLLEKTAIVVELTAIIKKNRTAICKEVADKVREIRKTKLLDGDEMFNRLIEVLAKNGYLTI